MNEVEVTLNAILALFAIMNPLGNMPVYLEYTEELDSKTRKKLFQLTVLTGAVTLLVLTFTGRWIMQYVFQITIDEFRIAGGILLTLIAVLRIVSPVKHNDEHSQENILEMGIVPMAIPLLVGPGAIVTSILILDRDGWLISLISLSVTFVICWGILRSAVFLHKVFGKFGSLVISRIMYIFIAAIGVHFLLTGIAHVFNLPLHL